MSAEAHTGTNAEGTSKRTPAAAAGGVSRATCLRLVLLFGPLLLVLVLTRLLAYSFISRGGIPPLGELLPAAALAPALLMLAAAGLYVGLRRRWPGLRTAWRFGLVSLAGAPLTVAGATLAPSWTTEWLSIRAFEAVRWDVLLLLLTALAFLFVLERTRGRARLLGLAALYALVFWLMAVAVMTFGYLLSTGSPPDSTLLRQVLLHLPDTLRIASSEARGARGLLLLSPVLVVLLPAALARVPAVRRWTAPSEAPAGTPWHVLGGALPLLLLLALPPSTRLPAAYEAGTYVGLLAGLAEPPAPEAPRADPPPFDTRALELVPTDSTRRLNVVLVLLESTRARSTTPYNPALDTTPFLDSLARHALLVEHMYAVVPYTNKTLAPLLAGIYPYPHREMVEARPGALPGPGLPTLLRPLGYRSAFFTPADLRYERKDLILQNLGFDAAYGDGAYPTGGFEQTNYFGYEDRIMIEPSMAWVDACLAADAPFFLAYLTLVAHHPYHVPSSFPRRDYGVADPALDDYLNAVRYTDAFLRELFQAFAERGLLDRTLFLILGDHGQAFGEHMQRMHNDVLWEEALRVPALVYSPAHLPGGIRVTGRRQHIDLLPTVADVLRLRPEGGSYPGVSLLKPVAPGRTLYHSGWESRVALALRQDSLKFLYRFQQRPLQAFDVSADSLERHDVAGTLPQAPLHAAEHTLQGWRRGTRQAYMDHLRQIQQ